MTDEAAFETELDAYRDRVSRPVLRLFRAYAPGQKAWLALGLATSVLAYGTVLVTPLVLGTTIDAVFTGESAYALPLVPAGWLPTDPTAQFWLSAAIVGGALLGGTLLQWVRGVTMNFFAHGVMYSIRVDAWLDLHDDLQSELRSRLPSGDEAPSIALINSGSEPAKGTFYVLDLADKGYEKKPYRDLGVVDDNAFAGVETGKWGETDYETMLEVDPDVIIVHWGITFGSITFDGDGAFDTEEFRDYIAPMEDDPVGSELTAVQENRVLPGPTAEQGPFINAFQTELTARLLFPEQFGEVDFDAPLDVPEEEQLFDRQRARDIINGDI